MSEENSSVVVEQVTETAISMTEFETKIKDLININSMENASNTPDWILAQYLSGCLAAFTIATQQRESWYGHDARPSEPGKTHLKECEAVIKFAIPKEKVDLLYAAIESMKKLGVTFDTGGSKDEEGNLCYDWELDWSLKGPAKVYFKRFKKSEVVE